MKIKSWRSILRYISKIIAFIFLLISALFVIGCTYRLGQWGFGSPRTFERLAALLYHDMPIEFYNGPNGETLVRPIKVGTKALVVEYILIYVISVGIFFLSGIYFFGLMDSFRERMKAIFTKQKIPRKA